MTGRRPGRIGVLVGGEGPEREASVAMGDAVLAALDGAGHDARAIHVSGDLDLALRQGGVDLAFVALQGAGGGGPVQGLLETLGIPYTGSSFGVAALAADKLKTKELLRLHNLPTPAYYRHAPELGGAV